MGCTLRMPFIICSSSAENERWLEAEVDGTAEEAVAEGAAARLAAGENSSRRRSSIERRRSRSSRSPEKALAGSDAGPTGPAARVCAVEVAVSEPADWCSKAGRSSAF